jgi:hypothetical protein
MSEVLTTLAYPHGADANSRRSARANCLIRVCCSVGRFQQTVKRASGGLVSRSYASGLAKTPPARRSRPIRLPRRLLATKWLSNLARGNEARLSPSGRISSVPSFCCGATMIAPSSRVPTRGVGLLAPKASNDAMHASSCSGRDLGCLAGLCPRLVGQWR